MPRLIRDWTLSEKMNQLSAQAEVLFMRLCMKCDDYGGFHARPSLIKANLFPLRLDNVREADISRWISELVNTKDEKGEKAGLIVVYEVDSKPYLRIVNFGQKLKRMKKLFPDPPPDILEQLGTMRDNEGQPSLEVEEEVEVRNRSRRNKEPDFFQNLIPDSLKLTGGFIEAWTEWIVFRKNVKKKPVSETGAKEQLEWLSKQSLPVEIIKQSLKNEWQGLFELKEKSSAKKESKVVAQLNDAARNMKILEDEAARESQSN